MELSRKTVGKYKALYPSKKPKEKKYKHKVASDSERYHIHLSSKFLNNNNSENKEDLR